MIIQNVIFEDISAERGAAVNVVRTNGMWIFQSTISRCKASYSGGGIYVDSTELLLAWNVFSDNLIVENDEE